MTRVRWSSGMFLSEVLRGILRCGISGTPKSFAGYPMWEILVVGGQTPDGKDASNELSYMCLDAAADLQTTQPVPWRFVFSRARRNL